MAGIDDGKRYLGYIVAVFALIAAFYTLAGAFSENDSLFRTAQWILLLAFLALPFVAKAQPQSITPIENLIDKRTILIVLAAPVITGLIAYTRILTMPFMDGDEYIHIMDAKQLWQNFDLLYWYEFFVKVSSNDAEQLMRPLLNLPFLVGYPLFGTEPTGYHVMNLIAHIVSGFFLGLFTIILTGRRNVGILAAALFTGHPLITKPIAWTATLTHSFPTAIFFAALFCWAMFRLSENKRRWFVGACVLLILDLFMWELGVILPVSFILVDLTLHSRIKWSKERLPVFRAYAIPGALILFYLIQLFARINLFDHIHLAEDYFKARFTASPDLTIGAFVGALTEGLLRPLHRSVFIGHSYVAASATCLLGFCILIVVSAFKRKFDRKVVLLAFALLVLTYLPTKNSAQLNIEYLMRARLFLIPTGAFCILIASLLLPMKKPKISILFVGGIIAFLFAALASGNNQAWLAQAKQQEALEMQLEYILSNHKNDNVIFLFNPAPKADLELYRDAMQTMFTRWYLENPIGAACWGIFYNAKIAGYHKVILVSAESDRIYIRISSDLTKLSDQTEFVNEKIQFLISNDNGKEGQAIPLTEKTHPADPWKFRMSGLVYPGDGRLIYLEGESQFICNENMKLHTPSTSINPHYY